MLLSNFVVLLAATCAHAVITVDLDDRNTPPIVYIGSWKQVVDELVNGTMAYFYDGTSSHTQNPGDMASLTFAGEFSVQYLFTMSN